MPQIRVLHIVPDMEAGGAQSTVVDLAAHLDRDRFRPRVCCLAGGGPLVGRLAERGVPFHLVYASWTYSPAALWKLAGLIREHGIHVVHTHLPAGNHLGALAARLAGAPVLCLHHHDSELEQSWWERPLTRWAGARADRIFCVSADVRSSRLAAGLEPSETLELFPPFIEPAEYRDDSPPAAMKAELGIPADGPCIGIVGRLVPWKNHELFLQTARRLAERHPRLHFAIIGEGPERERIRDRVRELGLGGQVTLTGYRGDMPRVYRALDAVALCGTRVGFGKVVLEAQACGVPVVALEAGGITELLAEGGGYLVAEPRAEAFAAALEHALGEEERERLRFQGARNVARFSATRLITRLEDLYEDLCEAKHAFRHIYAG